MTAPTPTGPWQVVTLKWLARMFTGGAIGGELQLRIDHGAPLLFDDPAAPVSIFTSTIDVPLTTLTLGGGAAVREYMYVEVDVPASDDPDIVGDGFTYTATVHLDNGHTYGPFTFTVPADAPGGVVWISTALAVEAAPCELLPQITLSAYRQLQADVDALTARVAALE